MNQVIIKSGIKCALLVAYLTWWEGSPRLDREPDLETRWVTDTPTSFRMHIGFPSSRRCPHSAVSPNDPDLNVNVVMHGTGFEPDDE